MQNLITKLEKLDFSKIEASVYISLLQHSEMNGSQISKMLNLSRSAVYSALNSLYEKGAVVLLPGGVNIYKAESPDNLIEAMKEKFVKNAEMAKKELSELSTQNIGDEYWNIKGHDNFVLKVKEFLLEAKEEIYLNTNYELETFKKEFDELEKRGVRIILYSLEGHNLTNENIEFYYNSSLGDIKNPIYKRMMMVVDYKKALIASGKIGGEFIGTFTENELLVNIISEHIHNDIYMLKFFQRNPQVKFDDEEMLGTKMERKFEEKIRSACKGEKS